MKPRAALSDLAVFVAVARAKSFTKAATELGVSPSALSHAMRQLEEQLGVRLLARTTRSVAPTQAGDRLQQSIAPHLAAIEAELAALRGLRDKPAGVVRLTAGEHAAITLVYPAIARLAASHPDVRIELSVDNAFVDIVANQFDAGVRLGEEIERDMIAVRIGPDMRMAIVATPSYFARHPAPGSPQELTRHNCINIRLPTYGSLVPWEFEQAGQRLSVRVEGQLTFNARINVLGAVLDGLGLACCPEDLVTTPIREGRLVRVLEDWCQPFPGYYLYYAGRRQLSPLVSLLIEALRYGGVGTAPGALNDTIVRA